MLSKLKYFLMSLKKTIIRSGFTCPSCGHTKNKVIDRKYLVTTLRRCDNCKLLFRAPTTTPEENKTFYQKEYSQGMTTELPSTEKLRLMVEHDFRETDKDYSPYLKVLDALGCKKGDKLLDFGCSWGYGSWQFKKYGYSVQAFEISEPRCNFARQQLGINASSSLDELEGTFDIFFSAHVLEHVPSVSQVIDNAFKLIKPGGLFVAFTPNGSNAFREKEPLAWHRFWGLVHPNQLDDVYYNKMFAKFPSLIMSRPNRTTDFVNKNIDKIREWRELGNISTIADCSGWELLIVVRKP
jgi:cyclopropane fatty-acyl-phospholipid synthase-like methyltransferase